LVNPLAFIDNDFRFSSFQSKRESRHSLKKLDTRIRGYDKIGYVRGSPDLKPSIGPGNHEKIDHTLLPD
jgi:hypothetical protein